MAQRQVFGRDPVTGVPSWRYLDLGPQSAASGHGRPMIRAFVIGENGAHQNGGGQQKILRPGGGR